MSKKNYKDVLTPTKINQYLNCSFGYKCKYIDGIKVPIYSNALPFGSAIDEGLNSLLRGETLELAIEKAHSLIEHEDWSKRQFSKTEFQAVEMRKFNLNVELDDEGFPKANCIIAIKTLLKNRVRIMLYEYLHGFLKKYNVKVIEIQKKTDEGIIDLIAEIDTPTDTRITCVIDNKTAGKHYSNLDAEYNLQLMKYAKGTKIPFVGFVVLLKKPQCKSIKVCHGCGGVLEPRKRKCCGEIKEDIETVCAPVQVIIRKHASGDIRKMIQLEKTVKKGIDAGIFTCNIANCTNQFGRPCEYRDLFWGKKTQDDE